MDRSDAYRALADRAKLNRGWGDAFGYALVATGRADVMLDPKIAPWDCSPMPIIMAEAGGWSRQLGRRPGHPRPRLARLLLGPQGRGPRHAR